MAKHDEDTQLMMQVRRGDREAFRTLVERYKGLVVNMIYRAIGDSWEAEDLAQRVFIQVYRSAGRYKPKAKFTTWLFTIVNNTIRNEYRRRSRHPVDSMEGITEPTHDDGYERQMEDSSVVSPSDQAMHRELHEHIQASIARLPEQQRVAVILCRYEGLPYEEIAKIMKCSVSAVKSLLHRARYSLREALKEYY